MRTLAFCTAFGRGEAIWRHRYHRWAEAMKTNGVQFDLLLMVDDGSPAIIGLQEFNFLATIDDAPSGRYAIFRFAQSLGRQARVVYPGWFRSFAWAGLYAQRHGFDKVVHIESDAYVVSKRCANWINGITEGWHAPYCAHIRNPESAIQIIAGSAMKDYLEVVKAPFSRYVGFEIEPQLPFTEINRDLVGNRYGPGNQPVPKDADWASQLHGGNPDAYFWWM